jgi:hypothetical protein
MFKHIPPEGFVVFLEGFVKLGILQGNRPQVGHRPYEVDILRGKLARLRGIHSDHPDDFLPEHHGHGKDRGDSFLFGLLPVLNPLILGSMEDGHHLSL